ncbi:MAG: GNAT family N-acetyltransferase [Chloroflexota bacterium]|nr:GNAT family N-acetyltransferase [Chloroflexota bacterium]
MEQKKALQSERRPTAVSVRPPRPSDAGVLASLAGELGYPTDPETLLGRLAALHPADAAVMVATDATDAPIGWCHVELRRSLVAPLSALVAGLVITAAHRSSGIGAELLDAAERWARERNCARLVVATRVTRERAHRFYLREGYEIAKTSHLFEKRLD